MTCYTKVEVDIDDVLNELSKKEKQELLEDLIEELGGDSTPEDYDCVEAMRRMTSWEQKKVLCKVLGVSSYYAEQELRDKLESIIIAI